MMPQLEIKKISKEINELSKLIRLAKVLRRMPHNRPEAFRDAKWPDGVTNYGASERAHLLCCIRAHHHGRIHCKLHPTLEAQEAFIGDSWQEFAWIKDKPEVAPVVKPQENKSIFTKVLNLFS